MSVKKELGAIKRLYRIIRELGEIKEINQEGHDKNIDIAINNLTTTAYEWEGMIKEYKEVSNKLPHK